MFDEALVTDVFFPTALGPSFGVPILRASRHSNAFYVQRFDNLGMVAAFDGCDPPLEQCQPLLEPTDVVILGGEPIHAVRGPTGEILVGHRDNLRQEVAAWLPHIASATTRLAFAEFAEDDEAERRAAEQAYQDLSKNAGSASARLWFLDAIVLRIVLRQVFEAGHDVADCERLDQLASQCRVEAAGNELLVTLPTELESELNMSIEALSSRLQAAKTMARIVALDSVEVRAQPGGGDRRRGRIQVHEPIFGDTVSVVVVGDPALFEALAFVPEQRSDKFSAHYPDQIGPVFSSISTTDASPETVRNLLAAVEPGPSHATLLVIPAGVGARPGTETLIEAIVEVGREFGWSNHSLWVAFVPSEVTRELGELEARTSRFDGVSAVLSLANAWTPVRSSAKRETPQWRIVENIRAWAVAARSGGIREFRAATGLRSRGQGSIVTATRLRAPGALRMLDTIAAHVANPLWPSAHRSDLLIGADFAGGSEYGILSEEDRQDTTAARFFYNLTKSDGDHSGADVMFAVSICLASDERRRSSFELYIRDVLEGLDRDVAISSRPAYDLEVDRPGSPAILLQVRETVENYPATAQEQLDRGLGLIVVGETRRDRKKFPAIVSFDRLRELDPLHDQYERHLEDRYTSDPFPATSHGIAISGTNITSQAVVAPDFAANWLTSDRSVHRWLRPFLTGRDVARFPEGRWVLDLGRLEGGEEHSVTEQITHLFRDELGRTTVALPKISPRIRAFTQEGDYLLTPTTSKHRVFARCRGDVVPSHGLVAIREVQPWMMALLSSRVHRIWTEARGSRLSGTARYSVSVFECFPLPPELRWDSADDAFLARHLTDLSTELHHRRLDWQYEGLPVSRKGLSEELLEDLTRAIAMGAVEPQARGRSLARLYDENPPWLAELNERIDAVVSEVYGLRTDASSRDVMDRLASIALSAR